MPAEEGMTAAPPASGNELSLRSVLAGCVLGAVMAAANVYVGLKTGVWDSGMVFAAVVGFLAFSAAGRSGGRRYGPLENNITQTTSASCAVMPATAGVLGAIPALELLGHHYPVWAVALWGIALGIIGVLVGLVLRRRLFEEERLPFPSGIATAEVITALHSAAQSAVGRARALGLAGLGAGLWTWLRDGKPALLAAAVLVPGSVRGVSLAQLGVGVSFSPMLSGVGMLIGPLQGTAVLLGTIVAWVVLAPWLVQTGLVANQSYEALASWLIWPAVGLMLGEAVIALAGQLRSLARAAADLAHAGAEVRAGGARPRQLLGWIALGAAACALAIWVGRAQFGLHPLATLLAVLLSVLLCALCARAAGQTDFAPLSTMGQLTQVLYGLLLGGAPAANIMAASVPAGDAAQATQTLWSLRTGSLLGASRWSQVRAQFIGVVLGALVTGPIYALLVRVHHIGSRELPAPAARTWMVVGQTVVGGAGATPSLASWAALVAFAIAVVMALAARGRAAAWVPSPSAVAIGFVLPATSCVAIGAGGVGAGIMRLLGRERAERYLPAIAGGAVAGESLVGIVVTGLVAAGLLAR
jgi:putative OPT family oligopeptide transporter